MTREARSGRAAVGAARARRGGRRLGHCSEGAPDLARRSGGPGDSCTTRPGEGFKAPLRYFHPRT